MNINEILSSSGKHDREIVEIVKPHYPGVNRPLVVMVRNTEKYGVRFITRAEKLIKSALCVKPCKPRTGDGHRLSHRLSCRVSPEKYEGVNTAIKRRGYESTQEWLDKLTDYWMEHQEILRKGQE